MFSLWWSFEELSKAFNFICPIDPFPILMSTHREYYKWKVIFHGVCCNAYQKSPCESGQRKIRFTILHIRVVDAGPYWNTICEGYPIIKTHRNIECSWFNEYICCWDVPTAFIHGRFQPEDILLLIWALMFNAGQLLQLHIPK